MFYCHTHAKRVRWLSLMFNALYEYLEKRIQATELHGISNRLEWLAKMFVRMQAGTTRE